MDRKLNVYCQNQKKYINIIDIFRALAIFSIFLSHLQYLANTNFDNIYNKVSYARLGVDYFFVMSGFVLAFGYQEKFIKKVNKQEWFAFIKKRISKVYIPYIVCHVIGMIWFVYKNGGAQWKDFLIRFVISVPLMQSVVPFGNYANSFNGVAWFLSCVFVFYLITPFLLHLNSRLEYNLKRIILACVIDLLLFSLIYMLFRDLQYYRFPEMNFSLVYSTPYICIFVFCSGIIVYDLFEYYCRNNMVQAFIRKKATELELIFAIMNVFWWIYASNNSLPTVIQEEINIMLTGITIIIFSNQKGRISNFLLSRKLLKKFGSISMEFYLVHYLVINIGAELIFSFVEKNNVVLGCSIFIFFGISILLSVFLREISKRCSAIRIL